ncbi:hypothetical protein HPP92_016441 [Vanilla planifolia]|uniref:Uncharacterized protein n=1 Tax=Vanilla planifolia TaxID=51239 RepID=A0A835QF88_VANPL|nr:hypothetical protein HPP92_016441 [Vanilla planifolia]
MAIKLTNGETIASMDDLGFARLTSGKFGQKSKTITCFEEKVAEPLTGTSEVLPSPVLPLFPSSDIRICTSFAIISARPRPLPRAFPAARWRPDRIADRSSETREALSQV